MAEKPPRKSHPKTRSRCIQCKQRRVKCGEEGPLCNNCIRRGLTCTYGPSGRQHLGPPNSVGGEHGNPLGSDPAHRCDSDSKQSASDETANLYPALHRHEELCLVHHYTTSTCKTLSRNERDVCVWRNAAFSDGIEYSFLLNAILALAAMHKASLSVVDEERYTMASFHYQSQALQGYREHLLQINQENCNSLFAFSVLMNVLTLGVSRGNSCLLPTSPTETLFSIFELLRGTEIVLKEAGEAVTSGQYKALFTPVSLDTGATLAEDTQSAMRKLRETIMQAELRHASNEPRCVSLVDSLQTLFLSSEEGENFGMVLAWPTTIGEKAIEMLKSHHPSMILIAIHYGVLFLRIHERWWAHGFGRRLIEDLSNHLHALDSQYAPATEWARSKADSFCDSRLTS